MAAPDAGEEGPKSDKGSDPTYTPTLWPLENVLATSQRCEVCNEKISLQQAPLLDAAAPPTGLIRHETALAARARSSAADVALSVDELRYGRPLEVSSSLAQLLGLPPGQIDQLRAEGEAAIIAEFEAEDENPTAWTAEEMGVYAWSELDWCLYLSASKVETAAKLADDDERARAERSAILREVAKDGGLIDAGHKDTTIEYWLKRPEMAAACLTRGQVLALRLITSPVAAKINRALRNGCDASRPHPYPATTILLCDGLSKLWSAQLEQRLVASKAVAAAAAAARDAKVGGDEEAIAAAESASKQATADSELLKIGTLWQGVCGLSADVFKERGGTEVGFLCSCSSREAAQAQAVQQLQTAAAQAAAHSRASDEDGSAQDAQSTEASGEKVGVEGGAEGIDNAGSADDVEKDEGAPSAPVSPANALGGPDAAASADASGRLAMAVEERPVLLLKIEASLNLASAVNLSFCSPISGDIFCLPPGAYFEQRKAAVESIPFGRQGELLEVKVVDVVLHLPPSIAKQAANLADARVEGKVAREKAQL